MGKTRVVCSRTHFDYDVYIGRPSIWGSPFQVGPGRTARQAVEQYRQHLSSRPDLLARLHELRGKVLGCPCRGTDLGQPCHGQVLVEMIDGSEAGV